MPDQVTSAGLEVKSLSDLITELTTALQGIYGADIVVDTNSPDGQVIIIHAQAGVDIRELIQSVYNSFDPDQCEGVALDARCVINNIQRRGGTYSIVPVNITIDRTIDFVGLDDDYDNPEPDSSIYTVQDDAGNELMLIDSDTLTAGTHLLNFRAKAIGAMNFTAGTITTPKTIVLGVTAINNPGGASSVGEDQESDVELKIRRSQSLGNNANGYINGLEGYIKNLDSVTDAKVYENYEDSEVNGIPEHCIWAVVEGGSTDDIAGALYAKKAPGCDMKGSVEVDVDKEDGGTWTAKFDRPASKNLHIRFDYKYTEAAPSPDLDAIKASMVAALSYTIGQYAETSSITAIALDAITDNGGGGVPINVEISANGADWDDYLEVDTLDEKWVADVSRITITEVP